MDTFEPRLFRLEGAYEQVNERLGSIEHRLGDLDRKIDDRIDGLSARIDGRIDGLGLRIDGLQWRMTALIVGTWVTTMLAVMLHR